jgi:hypothetical protein
MEYWRGEHRKGIGIEGVGMDIEGEGNIIMEREANTGGKQRKDEEKAK